MKNFKTSLLSATLLLSLPVYISAESTETKNASEVTEAEPQRLAKELFDIFVEISKKKMSLLGSAGCCPCASSQTTCVSEEEKEKIEKEIEANINKAIELVKQGADVNYKHPMNGSTPLMGAVAMGSVELVKLLLEKKANPNPSKDMMNPIVNAAAQGNLEIVTALIEHGADVNSQMFGNSNTALTFAVIKNNIDLATMLIQNGADVNLQCETPFAKNKITFTALDLAVDMQNLEMTKFLLENGADTSIKSQDGETILEKAKKATVNKELLELLEKYSTKK